MVQPVQQTIKISQLQFDKIIDVPVCASCRFSGAGSEETVELPQLQLVEKSLFPDVQVVPFRCRGNCFGPCAQAHGQGGHVHRDMAPQN